MKFTVEEALNLDSLKESKVVAGHKGLDNPIRFINVMEVPDISDWISGHEMILTTAYPYRNSNEEWGKLIDDLKMKRLSAFAIKVDRYISHIPKEVKDMGDEFCIPIIELPPNARFDLIIRDVMRQIVNKDYSLIKKVEKIHRNFTEIILSGGGLKEVVNILSTITDSTVIVEDKDENILAESYNEKKIKNSNNKKEKEEKMPIVIYNRIEAYLKMISSDKSFERQDIMAMERARDVIAIVILKKRGEEEIEKRYRNDFLNEVIKGGFNSKDSLVEKGRFFNMDFNNSYLLFLLDIDSLDIMFSKEFKKRKIKTYNILSDLFSVVFNSFFSRSKDSIIWSTNRSIFVLYPIKKENIDNSRFVKDMSIKIAKKIKSKVDQHIKEFTISIGIGRFYKDILDINKSFEEAKEALRIGKLVWGDSRVYHYDDIETYNILMRSGSNMDLEKFVNQKLGKLISYDKKKNTELLITLKEILENDGNLKTTSEKMFLHSKTISYRRDQIEEILGISFSNMEEKFSIYMALKIKDIISF